MEIFGSFLVLCHDTVVAEFSGVYSDSAIKLGMHLTVCVSACVFVFYETMRRLLGRKQVGKTL